MEGKDNFRSWIALSIVTFLMFLEIGIIKGFSVLLPDLKEQLATHTWIVGSCIAIITGLGYTLGVSADALVKICGPRVSIMASGLLSSIGLIVCSCAVNPFTLLLGLIFTGFLLVQENVGIGVIPDYFDKYYETAVCIYSCGTGLGIIIMPILTQLLLDVYGWRGALILLSGLTLHSIPCGALLKTQTIQPKELERNPLMHSRNDNPAQETTQEFSLIRCLKDVGKIFGVHLLTKLPFIARVLVPAFVWGYTIIGWMIYMVSFAVSKGASIKQASFVATSGGIGLTFIRLALPLVHKMMNYKQIIYVASIIQAIAMFLTAISVNYIALNIISVVIGLGLGALGTEIYIAAGLSVDKSEYYHAIAWLHVFYGFAGILSGFITGLLFDMTGNFTLSFSILAAVSLLPVVSLGLESTWTAVRDKHSRRL